MKFHTALTLFAVLATSKLAYGQSDESATNDDAESDGTVNIATQPAAPVLETYIPDIYWWTAIVPADQVTQYITEPLPTKNSENSAAASEVTSNAESSSDAAETPTASAAESGITSVPESSATSDSALPTPFESGVSSVASELSSVSADASSAISSAISSASSAWSSQYSASSAPPASFTSVVSQTISVAKPSSSVIPSATSATPPPPNPNDAYTTRSSMGKVVLSVAISAILAKILN